MGNQLPVDIRTDKCFMGGAPPLLTRIEERVSRIKRPTYVKHVCNLLILAHLLIDFDWIVLLMQGPCCLLTE